MDAREAVEGLGGVHCTGHIRRRTPYFVGSISNVSLHRTPARMESCMESVIGLGSGQNGAMPEQLAGSARQPPRGG